MAQVEIINGIRLNSSLIDYNGDAGTSGQILSSTGDGVNWVDAPASGISGSGAAGQVTFWNGTSSVTGENDLYWDSANNELGIGTNNPNYSLHVVDLNPTLRLDVGSLDVGTIKQKGGILSLTSQASSTVGGQIKLNSSTNTTNIEIADFQNTGRLKLGAYGSGSFTGTATKMLAVTATGIVVEETLPTGGGSMDDWIINADTGLGWPHTITDGDTVTIAGGTNISTVGSVTGNTVTINQDQYYQTFHFNSTDKNTGGTYYMEWDSAGAQNTVNQQSQYIALRNGDFTKIKWFSNVAVAGNITMTLYNNTTSLWTSGNFTSSANTAVNFTPNVAVSENQRLNLEVVYPSGYGGGFNITAEFAWDL